MGMFASFLNRVTKWGQISSSRRLITRSAGEIVSPDTAMKVSAFYRGVIYISSQIAKLPWEVKDADNKVIYDKISTLLDLRPNPEMNAMTFRLLAVQTALVEGNFYAEIESDSIGRPIAIWPIETSRVCPERTIKGELIYRITGNDSSDVYLKPSEIFHIKNFHTRDGIHGLGLISYASDVLGISLGTNKMAGNLFSNGGMPSGVLEVQGSLSDEAFERIKSSWTESNSGKNSMGVAVLEDGVKFTPISMNPDVLQLLDSRKFNVLEIARFLGLPPTKLFDIDGAKFGNMENANLEVATDTLDAWAKNFEMEADVKILKNRFNGRRSEMDLYQVFRGDMMTRANYFSKMMQSAAITPNEIRDREGMSPYAEGDRFLIAANNYVPADRMDEVIDAEIKSKEKKEDPKAKQEEQLTEETLNFLRRKR